MDEQIYFLINKLKNAIDNDDRIIALNKIEKEMNESEEVMLLAYKKDLASNEYSDLLKIYDENSDQVIASRNRLLEAKERLESHPLVKEYLKAYKEVRLLLFEVNNILFKDFRGAC